MSHDGATLSLWPSYHTHASHFGQGDRLHAFHASSRLFSGWNVDQTRERGGNQAYFVHVEQHEARGHAYL